MNENVRWYYTDFYIIIYCKLAFFSIKVYYYTVLNQILITETESTVKQFCSVS